jgi:hypothetical protein
VTVTRLYCNKVIFLRFLATSIVLPFSYTSFLGQKNFFFCPYVMASLCVHVSVNFFYNLFFSQTTTPTKFIFYPLVPWLSAFRFCAQQPDSVYTGHTAWQNVPKKAFLNLLFQNRKWQRRTKSSFIIPRRSFLKFVQLHVTDIFPILLLKMRRYEKSQNFSRLNNFFTIGFKTKNSIDRV